MQTKASIESYHCARLMALLTFRSSKVYPRFNTLSSNLPRLTFEVSCQPSEISTARWPFGRCTTLQWDLTNFTELE